MARATYLVGESFETRLLHFFNRRGRHLLIGEIALEIGYRLETVEHHLEELVHRGGVRHLSLEEKKSLGLHKTVLAYVLVDPTKFTEFSQPL